MHLCVLPSRASIDKITLTEALPMPYPLRFAFVTVLALLCTSKLSGSGSSLELPANSPAKSSKSENPAPPAQAGTQQFDSSQPASAKTVHITVDVLSNRHAISPYVY